MTLALVPPFTTPTSPTPDRRRRPSPVEPKIDPHTGLPRPPWCANDCTGPVDTNCRYSGALHEWYVLDAHLGDSEFRRFEDGTYHNTVSLRLRVERGDFPDSARNIGRRLRSWSCTTIARTGRGSDLPWCTDCTSGITGPPEDFYHHHSGAPIGEVECDGIMIGRSVVRASLIASTRYTV